MENDDKKESEHVNKQSKNHPFKRMVISRKMTDESPDDGFFVVGFRQFTTAK